jgi:diguanylate cyclase (GGDEF)-like protein/PAS domain S-box-containing protein
MLVGDLEGNVLYANHAAGDVLGYPRDHLGESRILDLVHPDDPSAARFHLDRLMRLEKQEYRGEHLFRHSDGSPLWVLVTASVLPPEGPDHMSLLIVQVASIELQKRAEKALSHSESRWNFALESARQGVWDHDLVSDTMFYSRMWRIMRGLPPDMPVARDHLDQWLSRIHPDDLPALTAAMELQNDIAKQSDTLEYRERLPDGSYVWILSRGRPVEWDEHGKPTRTLGTDTDVTAMKTIEMELAAERERLHVTLNSIAEGMVSTDENGIVAFANPAALTLTGYADEEVVGRPAREIFALRHGVGGPRAECPVATSLSSGTVVSLDGDLVLQARDGTERAIRCTASPVTGAGKHVMGVVLVFQDVTESRRVQRELAHLASHDPLTGLPNRVALETALEGCVAAAPNGGLGNCLLFIDLDRFKPVNDASGHAAGDALLCQVARTIQENCRGRDLCARLGGDEFAVLLRDCSPPDAKLLADKLVRAIADLDFNWAGRSHRIGASIGMTVIRSDCVPDLGFLGEADAACYAAKDAGRGTAIVFAGSRCK